MYIGLPSLNFQYFFAYIYGQATGVQIDPNALSGQAFFIIQSIGEFGMVLSVVLVVLIVYVRIRLEQVEHHGFAELAEREHERQVHHETAAKNPQWEAISALASSPNESDWRRAILEADIMLAKVLSDRGYVGDTLGEQLKTANPLQFTTLDLAWEAHRMRNAIAHLGEAFPVSERDARATIDQYRRVFEEFNII
jgi:hypothetical protein